MRTLKIGFAGQTNTLLPILLAWGYEQAKDESCATHAVVLAGGHLENDDARASIAACRTLIAGFHHEVTVLEFDDTQATAAMDGRWPAGEAIRTIKNCQRRFLRAVDEVLEFDGFDRVCGYSDVGIRVPFRMFAPLLADDYVFAPHETRHHTDFSWPLHYKTFYKLTDRPLNVLRRLYSFVFDRLPFLLHRCNYLPPNYALAGYRHLTFGNDIDGVPNEHYDVYAASAIRSYFGRGIKERVEEFVNGGTGIIIGNSAGPPDLSDTTVLELQRFVKENGTTLYYKPHPSRMSVCHSHCTSFAARSGLDVRPIPDALNLPSEILFAFCEPALVVGSYSGSVDVAQEFLTGARVIRGP